MRISDWSSDVCSSDLITASGQGNVSITTSAAGAVRSGNVVASSITVDTAAAPVDGVTKTSFAGGKASIVQAGDAADAEDSVRRSEEHTSELQSLMRTSYAVFCLKNNYNDE